MKRKRKSTARSRREPRFAKITEYARARVTVPVFVGGFAVAGSEVLPMADDLERMIQSALAARGNALRRTRTARAVRSDALNFCSNDYLGLSGHPKVVEAMARAARQWGAGSRASALIAGYTEAHVSAERAIARWKRTESAVLLPSGYQANHAVIQAIAGGAEAAGQPVRFFFDKLTHASLVDAIVGSGKPFRRFEHNDVAKLERLLEQEDQEEHGQDQEQRARQASPLHVVVTESIFSMDDAADLRGLVELKRRRPFVLLLDEAHGSGVYGPSGSGYAAEAGVSDSVDIFIATLSKAAGVMGGAICGPSALAEAVVNFGRAYIYSTALSPAIAAACEAAIEVMRDEPERQQRVRQLAQRVRTDLTSAGWEIGRGDAPIIPIILGTEEAALSMSQRLREKGIIVSAVRPPTVPRGSSRLRITLSAVHSDEEVARLVGQLAAMRKERESM